MVVQNVFISTCVEGGRIGSAIHTADGVAHQGITDMTDSKKEPNPIERAGEDLFDFAVDRDDVKWLIARLPEESPTPPGKVEYELQILKIIAVGWCIAYQLENHSWKQPLAERYWQAVQEFSQSLSETTGLLIGQDIDYFQTLKERLDQYVHALRRQPDATEPATVVGPEFARICGNADDLFVFMTGSKMFINAVQRVRTYLQTVAP